MSRTPSFRSQRTFLAVVATKPKLAAALIFSLFNFNSEARLLPLRTGLESRTPLPVHKERSLQSSQPSEKYQLCISLLNFNSEACLPPVYLFPFTRNVPCSRRNQAKNSSCRFPCGISIAVMPRTPLPVHKERSLQSSQNEI